VGGLGAHGVGERKKRFHDFPPPWETGASSG
jgi:hypothetical protein